MNQHAHLWPRRGVRLALLLTLAIVVASCGGGGNDRSAQPSPASNEPSDAIAGDEVARSNRALDASGAVFKLSAEQSRRAELQSSSINNFAAAQTLPSAQAGATTASRAVAGPAAALQTTAAVPSTGIAVAQVVALVKTGETRVDRTTFDYTFKVVLESPSKALAQATAVVQSVGTGTSVMDGAAIFDAVTAGGRADSSNTITLRHDRTKPFNTAAVTWVVRTFTEPTRAPIETTVQRAVLDPALLDGTGILTADAQDPSLLVDSSGSFGSIGAVLLLDGSVRRIRDIQTAANGRRLLVTEQLPATAAFKDLAFTTTVNPLAAVSGLREGAAIETGPQTLSRKLSLAVARIFAASEPPPFLDFVLNNRFACFVPTAAVESEEGDLEMRWTIGCSFSDLGTALGKSWPNLGSIKGHYIQKTSQTYKRDQAAGDDYTVNKSRSELNVTLSTTARVAANQLPVMDDPSGRCQKKGEGVECEWPLFKKLTYARKFAIVIAGVPIPIAVAVRPKLTLELSGEGAIKGFRVSTRETIVGVRGGVKLPDPDASSFSDAGSTPLIDATYGSAANLTFSAESRLMVTAKMDVGSIPDLTDVSIASVEGGAGVYVRGGRVAPPGSIPCFSVSAGGVAALEVNFLDSAFLRNLGLFDGIKLLELEKLWPNENSKYSRPNGCADATDSTRVALGYVIVGKDNYKADAAQSSLNRDVYVASGDWLLQKRASGEPVIIDFTKVFTENPGFDRVALDGLLAEAPSVGTLAANLTVSRNGLDGTVTSALYRVDTSRILPGDKVLVTAVAYQDADGQRDKTRSQRLIRIDFERPPQVTASYEFQRKPNGAGQFIVNIAYADEATRLGLASARIERGDGSQESLGRSFELDAAGNSVYVLKSTTVVTRDGLGVPVRPYDDDEAQRPKWLLLESPTTEGIPAVYRVPLVVDSVARVDNVVFANQGPLQALDAVQLTVFGHNLPAALALDIGWCSNLNETVTDATMFSLGLRSTIERAYTCTATRTGAILTTTVLGYAATPQVVQELTGLEVRGPATVTQGEPTGFSVYAARFSDYARSVVTVIWNFGEGVVREVQGLGQQVSYVFTSAGEKFVSLIYQAFSERIGGEPSLTVNVQASAGLVSVTAVTPLTAIAGITQTFEVIGSNLPVGLVFMLEGCSGVSEVQVGSSDSRRRFSCTFDATAAEREYDGTVAASSSPFGATPYFSFKVRVSRITLGPVTPVQTVRSIATSFEFRGQNLPTTGITVVPVGSERSNCQAPNNATTTGFGVACELFTVGPQVLEVRQGSQVLGSGTVNVASNVTRVSWVSPSTSNSGMVRFRETVTFTVHGQNLTADPRMGFAVEKCGDSNVEVGIPTPSRRTFTCLFNDQAGAVAGQMAGVVKDAPSGQVLLSGWAVPVEVAAPSMLNDTGVAANQCYQVGSNVLVDCNSPTATALSDRQDGMTGRDVDAASSGNSDGALGFSYGEVDGHDRTECVRDNVTGLMWEGKTADGGLRDGGRVYTNFGDGREGDASAHVAAVNSAGLCGFTDWRLPTVEELHGLVKYGGLLSSAYYNGVLYPILIDGDWFPNANVNVWSSTPPPASFGGSGGRLIIGFAFGTMQHGGSVQNSSHVRLVRLSR